MRSLLSKAALFLVLAALGLVVWLTRNPDAALLEAAGEWPVVGSWARSFRQAYRPPPEPAPSGIDSSEPEIVIVDRRGVPVDAPGGVFEDPDRVLGARPVVWVREATPLRAAPEDGAEVLARTAGIANLRWSERRGDWYRVRYRGDDGWVHLEGYEESGEPPLGRDPLPAGPLTGRAPDAERLGFALSRIAAAEVAEIGGYPAYLERDSAPLVAFLDRVAEPLEAIYAERYGVRPIGLAAAAIVLFARREDFEAYQAEEPRLHGLRPAGVTGHGIVAVDLEGRLRPEIAATLVHEVTHLLNRRALGPALPPWLDEGLADDLAHSKIDERGELDTARLGGVTLESATGWHWRGALAAALALRRAVDAGTLRPLAELLALDWSEFVAAGSDELNYAHAAFFVRHLLDDPQLAAGFRSFLAGVAAGRPAEGEELRRQLGREWRELDEGFARWVQLRFHEPR